MWRGCCGILVLVGVVMVQMIGMSRSMPHPQPQQHPTSLVKTCGSKLLEGIKTFCRNPDAFLAFHYSMQARSNLQQKRSSSSQYGLHNTPNLFSRVSDDPYEDDGGSEEEEDFADGEEGDEDEYERKGRSIETERKDIVQACCRNACSPQEFSRFCAMTDNGERSTITTRKPTTTTTLPPPSTTPQLTRHQPHHHHRFLAVSTHRDGHRKRSNEEKKREKEMMKKGQEVLRTALRCLSDPTCSQKAWTQIPSTKVVTTNRLNPYSRFCSVGVESESGRRREKRPNQEEKQSSLLPYLVRILAGVFASKESLIPSKHPTSYLSNSEESRGSRRVYYVDARGSGPDSNGVAFGRPSFPNSNRVNHKPHHRLVTDKPFAPSLGTNLGTRDEVLFNH